MPIGRGALLLETGSRSHSEDQVGAGSRDQDACQRATAVQNPSDGSPKQVAPLARLGEAEWRKVTAGAARARVGETVTEKAKAK